MSLPYLAEPVAAGLLLALCAWAAGARWVAGRDLASSALGEWALATALGLGLLGAGGYVLAALGLLRALPVAALAVALAAPGALPAWRAARRLVSDLDPIAAAVGAGFAALALLLALYPPLPFDETLYHLPTARAYAASGGLPFLADLRLPVSPALFEVLAAEVLLYTRATAVHLISWLATAVTAALLIAWGERRGSRLAGAWAAAIYVGSPLVLYLQGTAYVEPLLAMFATASLFAWDGAERAERAECDGRGWFTAALFGGLAAATKYLGLFAVAVLLARRGWLAWRQRTGRGFVATAALAAAPALLPYGLILRATGNPLFPFLPGLFGTSAWSYDPGTGGGRLALLAGWLRAPFDAVFLPGRVGEQPPISPAYLLVLAVLIFGAGRFGRWVLALTIAYAAALPLVHTRYLLPAAPALALAGALELGRWPKLRDRRWAGWLAIGLLLPSLAWAVHRVATLGAPPSSAAADEAFLARRVPGYEGLAWLNGRLGDGYTVYGAWCEQLHDYARGRFLGDQSGSDTYARCLEPADPEIVHRRLRRRAVQFLLVPTRAAPSVAADLDGRLRRSPLFREVYRGESAAVYALVAETAP